MEYVNNGNIKNKIINNINELIEVRVYKYFIQIVSAINFLHENQIIFRNLSTNNLLLDEYDDIKLVDFSSSIKGSSLYKEIVFDENYQYSNLIPDDIKSSFKDYKLDIWLLGVVLYELVFGCFPYKSNTQKLINYDETNQKVLVDNDCINLIKSNYFYNYLINNN